MAFTSRSRRRLVGLLGALALAPWGVASDLASGFAPPPKATAPCADSPSPRLRRNLAEASAEAEASCEGDTPTPAVNQDDPSRPQTFTVTVRKYSFSPRRIEVAQDDLVKVTMITEDIPHSFTVDAYRIAKRAAPHQPVTFEFRADQSGSFPFYCNLEIDDGCRAMKGELVVRKK